jgi:hypothetical protein
LEFNRFAVICVPQMLSSKSRVVNPIAVSPNDSSSLPLYPRLLGPAWAELDEALRQAHLEGERLSLSGTFRIQRGTGRLARLVAAMLRMPEAGEAVATRLTVVRTASGERWTRQFAGSELITTQTAAADGTMRERFGMIEISCRLEASGGAICYRQVGAAICVGGLRIPLPRWLWPFVEGIEEADGPGQTRVSVRVTVPLIGHLISYDGTVMRENTVMQEE